MPRRLPGHRPTGSSSRRLSAGYCEMVLPSLDGVPRSLTDSSRRMPSALRSSWAAAEPHGTSAAPAVVIAAGPPGERFARIRRLRLDQARPNECFRSTPITRVSIFLRPALSARGSSKGLSSPWRTDSRVKRCSTGSAQARPLSRVEPKTLRNGPARVLSGRVLSEYVCKSERPVTT
jgi:hypothetical protein